MALLVLRTPAHLRDERRPFQHFERLPEGFTCLPKIAGDDVDVPDDVLRIGLSNRIPEFHGDRQGPVGRRPRSAIAHERPEAYRPIPCGGGLTLSIPQGQGETLGAAHVRVRELMLGQKCQRAAQPQTELQIALELVAARRHMRQRRQRLIPARDRLEQRPATVGVSTSLVEVTARVAPDLPGQEVRPNREMVDFSTTGA